MTHNTQQLEKILNEYIMGELTLDAYRQKRARYINDYIEQCEKDNTLRIPIVNHTDCQIQQETFAPPKEVSNSSSIFKLFIITFFISVAGVVWYISAQKIEPGIPTVKILPKNITEESILESQNNLEHTVGLFIFKFIERDNWSTSALSDFIVHWKSLTRQQQTALRKTSSFLQLSSTLRKRINEQKALKEINNKAKQQESLLIWFSTQLSISIN